MYGADRQTVKTVDLTEEYRDCIWLSASGERKTPDKTEHIKLPSHQGCITTDLRWRLTAWSQCIFTILVLINRTPVTELVHR